MSENSQGPSRRTVLGLAGGGMIAATIPHAQLELAAAEPAEQDGLTITRRGAAHAAVVLPASAPPLLVEAVELLVASIHTSTGATLGIVEAADPSKPELIHIYVGQPSPEAADHEPVLTSLRNRGILDGYLICTHPSSISILGATVDGTRYGIYEFLERFVGVRWLAPTAEWEDIPAHQVLVVPPTRLVHEPTGNLGRLFFRMAGRGESWSTWCRRNRITEGTYGRQPIGHSTYKFFPPSVFAKTHPQFYPVGNIPANDSVWAGWQPAYSDPATIPIAVDYLKNYFRDHPEETAISLSVNDTGGFCEQHPDHPHNPHRKNSTGFFDDMSEIYWPWVNEVVRQVRQHYPDKWFGTLAYRETLDPPAEELDDHVVVIICKDNYTWIDPAVRENCEWRITEWSSKASSIGYWDYGFGSTYVLPRVYPSTSNSVFRHAGQHDPKMWMLQTAPNWGEGPKYWVLTKQMWDPQADAEALTAEWCKRAVGRAAAPFLERYFSIWEKFWQNDAPKTAWFNDYKNFSYLWFPSADYLDVANPADMQVSRRLLEQVQTHATTSAQRRRAEILMELFEYYETAFNSWPRPKPKPTSPSAGVAVVDQVYRAARAWERRVELVERWSGVDRFAEDSVRGKWDYAFGWSTQSWDYWKPDDFTNLLAYLRQHPDPDDPLRYHLQAGTADLTSAQVRNFSQLVLDVADKTPPDNPNSSFEDALNGWTITPSGQATPAAAAARTGASGLRVTGAATVTVATEVALKPTNLIAVTAHFRTTAQTGSIRIDLSYLSNPPAVRTTEFGNPTLLRTSGGAWRPVTRTRVCPFLRLPAIQRARVTVRLLNLAPEEVIDLDDITIHTVPA